MTATVAEGSPTRCQDREQAIQHGGNDYREPIWPLEALADVDLPTLVIEE